MLNHEDNYSRMNNVIYKNGTPILYMHGSKPDLRSMDMSQVNYLNRYLAQSTALFNVIPESTKDSIVKMFFDLETTGLKTNKHGVHQISGYIEVDDIIVERFDFRVRPNPKAKIEQEAMDIGGVTEQQILAYPAMGAIYRDMLDLLGRHVNRYEKKDKMWLVGFNNRSFDDQFFRAWFIQNGDDFFGSWFWSDSLDVIVLASQYLLKRRAKMPNFKLMSVAKELGIEVDETKLHDSSYDVYLTRKIYRIVTHLEMEPSDELY
jgi:DNA polymerase-3 subunit epsilon